MISAEEAHYNLAFVPHIGSKPYLHHVAQEMSFAGRPAGPQRLLNKKCKADIESAQTSCCKLKLSDGQNLPWHGDIRS